MRLGDLCEFKIDFPNADFWLIRKGSENVVGKPTEEYSPEHIGVKVIRTDLLVPKYLYYVFMHLQMSGKFVDLAKGTLRLKHISINDIKNIRVG